MNEPFRNNIKDEDELRCFICHHLIKENNPTYQGFMAYGVPIHQECHAGIAEFEQLKRDLTESDEYWPTGTSPDAAQPPEYKEARAWNEWVRQHAEAQIDGRGATIPTDVIHRLNNLRSPGPLGDREFELVKMWSGVGAWTTDPAGVNDFYGIASIMQQISLLPPLTAHIKDWWLFNSHEGNFSMLSPDFHKICSESGILLHQTLVTALTSLLPDIPSVISIQAMLHNNEKERPKDQRQPVRLSNIVEKANALEFKRSAVLGQCGQRNYSVPEVQDILADIHIESIEQDCGLIRSDADYEQAVELYGDRTRRCKLCPNWFTVEPEFTSDDILYKRCPGCTVTDRPLLPPDDLPEPEVTDTASTTSVLQGSLF